jgi:hypothetical protein
MAGSKYARLTQVGVSVANRPIYALILMDPEGAPLEDRPRVLLLSGQHGDEPTPVKAMLDLAGELADTENPYHRLLLKRVAIVLIPVANPDGYARFTRRNARGADLNRSWHAPNQPETAAICSFLHRLKPHIVVDEHEWKTYEGNPNCVEVAGFGTERHRRLARHLAKITSENMPVDGPSIRTVLHHAYRDGRLAHRHFADSGICSMLVETSPFMSSAARRQAYRDFVMTLLAAVAFPPAGRLTEDIRATVQSGRPPDAFLTALYARPKRADNSLPYWFVLLLAACYVILRCVMGKTRPGARDVDRVSRHMPPGRLPMTDAVRLGCPLRARLALLKAQRLRPTDRGGSSPECRLKGPLSSPLARALAEQR